MHLSIVSISMQTHTHNLCIYMYGRKGVYTTFSTMQLIESPHIIIEGVSGKRG